MSFYSAMIALSLLCSTQIAKQGANQVSCLSDGDLRPLRVQLFDGGKKLAVAGDTFGGGPLKGGEWKIFDLIDGKCALNGLDGDQRCLGASGMCVSPDGSMLAVGGMRNLLFVHHANTGKLYWNLTEEGNWGGSGYGCILHS